MLLICYLYYIIYIITNIVIQIKIITSKNKIFHLILLPKKYETKQFTRANN